MTPSANTGQPPTVASHRPTPKASSSTIAVAMNIARVVIRPAATARVGPWRSAVSAPLSASKASLAKLQPIWISSAPSRQPAAKAQSMAVTVPARAVPTATGTAPAARVLGRVASNQGRNGMA